MEYPLTHFLEVAGLPATERILGFKKLRTVQTGLFAFHAPKQDRFDPFQSVENASIAENFSLG
jgi:hypothetical protein